MASPSSESNLFAPLPRWKMPWSEFVLSYGTQAVVIGILVWIPVLHPEILESPKKDYHAIELVPTPVPVNHTPQRQLKPVLVAELDPPPAALRLPAPQPQPKPKVEDAPAPEVKIAAKKLDPLPPTAAVIPKQIVRTNVFSTGSSARADHRARSRQGSDRRLRRSQRCDCENHSNQGRQHRAGWRI